jgi:hypothetical protein
MAQAGASAREFGILFAALAGFALLLSTRSVVPGLALVGAALVGLAVVVSARWAYLLGYSDPEICLEVGIRRRSLCISTHDVVFAALGRPYWRLGRKVVLLIALRGRVGPLRRCYIVPARPDDQRILALASALRAHDVPSQTYALVQLFGLNPALERFIAPPWEDGGRS